MSYMYKVHMHFVFRLGSIPKKFHYVYVNIKNLKI
jgi:hypothetical protein